MAITRAPRLLLGGIGRKGGSTGVGMLVWVELIQVSLTSNKNGPSTTDSFAEHVIRNGTKE